MEKSDADTYFRTLYDLITQTQVTDQLGNRLALDIGLAKATDLIISVRKRRNKVMVIGNGGSAAIASHIQNDLCKTCGVRSIVFNEAPLLTALSNDLNYSVAFEHLINLWADPGDVLVTISSSGKSENIIRAIKMAVLKDCHVITFSGFAPENPSRTLGHVNIYLPSANYGFVESAHATIAHFLTDSVMSALR